MPVIRDFEKFLRKQGLVRTNTIEMIEKSTIALDAVQWMKASRVLSQEMNTATGGLPTGLRTGLQREIAQLRARHITPIMVFGGVIPPINKMPSSQEPVSNKLAAKRHQAWKAFESGQQRTATAAFQQVGGYCSLEVQQVASTILRAEGIETYRAPYAASAQLAWMAGQQQERLVHAVYGGLDLLLFGVDKVIMSITQPCPDAPKGKVDWVDRASVLKKLGLQQSQLVDACLLAGFGRCRTFPPLLDKKRRFAFERTVKLIKKHGDGETAVKVHARNKEAAIMGYSGLFARTKVVIKRHPVLTPGATLAPIDVDDLKTKMWDLKALGRRFPTAVYVALVKEVVSPQVLNNLINEVVVDSGPLVDSEGYTEVLDQLGPLRGHIFAVLDSAMDDAGPLRIINKRWYDPSADLPLYSTPSSKQSSGSARRQVSAPNPVTSATLALFLRNPSKYVLPSQNTSASSATAIDVFALLRAPYEDKAGTLTLDQLTRHLATTSPQKQPKGTQPNKTQKSVSAAADPSVHSHRGSILAHARSDLQELLLADDEDEEEEEAANVAAVKQGMLQPRGKKKKGGKGKRPRKAAANAPGRSAEEKKQNLSLLSKLDRKSGAMAWLCIEQMLELTGMVSIHGVTAWGAALARANLEKLGPNERSALFLAVYLLRLKQLNGKLLTLLSPERQRFHKGAGASPDDLALRLLARVGCLLNLTVKTEAWTGPLDRNLCAFDCIAKLVERTLRMQLEASLCGLLTADERRKAFTPLTKAVCEDLRQALPFSGSFDTGCTMGLLVQAYVNGASLVELHKAFPQATDVAGDLARFAALWSSLRAVVAILHADNTVDSVADFDAADKIWGQALDRTPITLLPEPTGALEEKQALSDSHRYWGSSQLLNVSVDELSPLSSPTPGNSPVEDDHMPFKTRFHRKPNAYDDFSTASPGKLGDKEAKPYNDAAFWKPALQFDLEELED